MMIINILTWLTRLVLSWLWSISPVLPSVSSALVYYLAIVGIFQPLILSKFVLWGFCLFVLHISHNTVSSLYLFYSLTTSYLRQSSLFSHKFPEKINLGKIYFWLVTSHHGCSVLSLWAFGEMEHHSGECKVKQVLLTSQLPGTGEGTNGENILFKDMPPVTYIFQSVPTSQLGTNC